MHLRRTNRQTPSRWYWALKGLSDQQARNLNMRHTTNNRWCELIHGDYAGKHTARRPRPRTRDDHTPRDDAAESSASSVGSAPSGAEAAAGRGSNDASGEGSTYPRSRATEP